MLSRRSYFCKSLARVLALGIAIPLQAATPAPAAKYRSDEIEIILNHYQEAQLAYNTQGLAGLVIVLPFLKNESHAQLEKAFRATPRLPELSLQGKEILVTQDKMVLGKISTEEFQSGILRIGNQKIDLSEKLGFFETLRKVNSPNQAALERLLLPSAWANPVAVIGLLLALLTGITKAKNWQKKRAADQALENAYASNGIIGPDAEYGHTRAPSYSYIGNPTLARMAGRLGLPNASFRPDAGVAANQGSTAEAVAKFTKDWEKNFPNCNHKFNKHVLDSMTAIEGEVRQLGKSIADGRRANGGYSMKEKDSTGFNVPISLGGHTITSGGKQMSYCSSATYAAFLKGTNSYLKEQNQAIGPVAAGHFLPGHAKADNYGAWGVWNNNYGGAGDLAHYVNTHSGQNFGRQATDPAEACPGDSIKFNRFPGMGPPGHSVIFLGYQGSGENKELCYWSSNGSTQGYGVACENVKRIKSYSVLKVNDPTAITAINEKYRADSRTNGDSVYSARQQYTGPENQAARFHANLDAARSSDGVPPTAAAQHE